MAHGKVLAVHLKPAVGQIRPVGTLQAIAGEGFEGDRCRNSKSRQALFVGHETLEAFGFEPGTLREQITVEFPGLQTLPIGSRVKVGDVEFEITADCTPCAKMAGYLGRDPEDFKQSISLRRGMLANVLTDGTIRVGDEVTVNRA